MDLRMDKKQRDTFLNDVRIGVLGLGDGERGPLTAPLWYVYEGGGQLWFMVELGSRKDKLMSESKRVSLCVQNEKFPYSYVSIEGPIKTIEEVGAHDPCHDQIARRYLGDVDGPAFIESLPNTPWLKVTMQIERWLSMDMANA